MVISFFRWYMSAEKKRYNTNPIIQGDKHPSKVHYRNTSQQHTKGTNTSDIKR